MLLKGLNRKIRPAARADFLNFAEQIGGSEQIAVCSRSRKIKNKFIIGNFVDQQPIRSYMALSAPLVISN